MLQSLPRSARPLSTPTAPDPACLVLLQIEHQNLLFNDDMLADYLAQAHECGVPVAITEHSVCDRMRQFESTANALVVLSDLGADLLRARWPTKLVLRVHHGCPTWFPPRKPMRGMVLAAFGFLERHKGFFHLLDVLRAMPGTELLLFSYGKSAAVEAEWASACNGLPVRWERRYLPEAEIARQLAAEADLLVFWYDELPHISASGAVRIGLASGVPVLTSRTSWFADLVDVTYQPTDLGEGVARLLSDTTLREGLVEAAREFCYRHTWRRAATQYAALWDRLEVRGQPDCAFHDEPRFLGVAEFVAVASYQLAHKAVQPATRHVLLDGGSGRQQRACTESRTD